jgi:hypothetical protein
VFELRLGAFPARVLVDGDQLVAASAGPFAGHDVLVRLLLVPDRAAAARPLAGAVPAVRVGAVDDVLAAIDVEVAELSKKAERVGGLDRVWGVHFAALRTVMMDSAAERSAKSFPDDVKRVVRLVDGTRSIAALLAESPLPPPLTLRVVERLLALGVLERADVADGVDGVAAVDVAGGAVVVDAAAVVDAPARARGADRSWLEQRTSLLPQPAPQPSASTPSTSTSTSAPAPSTTAPTATEPTSAPETSTTAPTAETSATEPLLLTPKAKPKLPTTTPSTVAGTPSLPLPLPPPKPELSAWLGPEDEFFQSHGEPAAPAPTSWPPWLLFALVLAGAALGAVLARSCL